MNEYFRHYANRCVRHECAGEQAGHRGRQHRQRKHHRLQARIDVVLLARSALLVGQLCLRRRAVNVRYSISEQGNLSYTTSSTDLAIQGNGFFVVQDGAGTPYLTRAGSFVKNAEGYLENAAGFQLMGYPYGSNPPAAVVNGFTGLEAINVNNFGLTASPSTQGSFPANLNRDEAIVPAGSRPIDNVATAKIGAKHR